MKGSIIIICFFLTGLILGRVDFVPVFFIENNLSSYALYLLMFLVGIGIGADSKSFSVLKSAKFKIFLVPICVVFGSFIGILLVSPFVSIVNLKDSIAIGAGFGYYSLSSIFITELSGETAGVIALVSNILREIITLLVTPLFSKYFGKLAPIASGGATSMDTTLPIITKYVGTNYAIISVFSGTILTILVPFLVPFILSI